MLSRVLLPSLIERKGMIVNIGSAITCVPNSALGAYGQTKAGLAYWNDALRREMSSKGVTVCLVEPGPIKTEFMDALTARVPDGGKPAAILDNAAPWMTANVEEVARQVARLLDRPRRRLSILKRFVWPFRVLGVDCPPLPAARRLVGGDAAGLMRSPATLMMNFPRTDEIANGRDPDPRLFRDDQFEPHALSRAVAHLYGHDARGTHAGRLAQPDSRLAGDLALHGDGTLRGDGIQSSCRSSLRRAESRTASRHLPAGRLMCRFGRQLHTIGGGLHRLDAAVLPNRWPLYLSVPVLFWLLDTPTASVSPAWHISGLACRSAWRRWQPGLHSAGI